MQMRKRKQLFIVAIVGVPLFLLASASFGPRLYRYVFPPAPPPAEEMPVELLWAKAFPGEREPDSSVFVYDAASRIRNTSGTTGIRRLLYRFELRGSDGELFYTRAGESYLRRGEAKYIVENNLESPRVPASVRFVLTEVDFVEDSGSAEPPLVLTRREFSGSTLRGTVLNAAVTGFNQVDVAAVLFDNDGKPLRARSTNFSRFLPREEREFRLVWSDPGPAVSYEVEAGTNILDPANYLPEERSVLEQ